jgi:hypothetical protein
MCWLQLKGQRHARSVPIESPRIVQMKSLKVEAFKWDGGALRESIPKTFAERVCRLVWMVNVAGGIVLAMAGGLLCCVIFGNNARVNLLGLTMNAFLVGWLAVFVGVGVAVFSIWRIRRILNEAQWIPFGSAAPNASDGMTYDTLTKN